MNMKYVEFSAVKDLIEFLSAPEMKDRDITDKYGENLIIVFNAEDSGEDIIFSPNLEAMEFE